MLSLERGKEPTQPPAEQNGELNLEKGRGLHPLQTRRRLLGADAYSKAGTAGRGSAAKAPPELLLKVGSHQKDGIHALKARMTLSHQRFRRDTNAHHPRWAPVTDQRMISQKSDLVRPMNLLGFLKGV